ncbi:MAG: alpha-N-arabinofuranosidase [Bifidobacteriaceae bacterium]|jgi:alpha-N-arabinofuranosidase|nr:alpha-N-arabinofuranosidase [Bifidobacteriaceae bacterium]
MLRATIALDRGATVAQTDDRLFSSFLEHLGRAIYTGIFEPDHPVADKRGFRRDVLELVRDLGVSHVRYPGGNFLSGYDWWDGVGPRDQRPTRLDLAWHSLEPNLFGWGEFADWSKAAGTQIMGAVNLGTGTPMEAGHLLEYTNRPADTLWADRRVAHGHPEPWDVRLWCLGNEMDGEWQIGHLEARAYGLKAREAAKIMRQVDPSIELVACGSATVLQPTFPAWDRVVLEETFDQVDYLSLHRYYENEGNDLDFLASFVDMGDFIHTIGGTVDHVRAVKRSRKQIYLSFDEWNVWYQAHQEPHPWEQAPRLLEDRYSLLDALVFAGLGMTLVNHADRVKIACLAQLVNVIAPILTEPGGGVLKQTIYYPFQLLSRYGRGTVLRPSVQVEQVETRYGEAPLVHTSVVADAAGEVVTVFLLSIADQPVVAEVDLRGFGARRLVSHTCLEGPDLGAVNTFAVPDAVVPREVACPPEVGVSHQVELGPRSFHVLRFGL